MRIGDLIISSPGVVNDHYGDGGSVESAALQ